MMLLGVCIVAIALAPMLRVVTRYLLSWLGSTATAINKARDKQRFDWHEILEGCWVVILATALAVIDWVLSAANIAPMMPDTAGAWFRSLGVTPAQIGATALISAALTGGWLLGKSFGFHRTKCKTLRVVCFFIGAPFVVALLVSSFLLTTARITDGNSYLKTTPWVAGILTCGVTLATIAAGLEFTLVIRTLKHGITIFLGLGLLLLHAIFGVFYAAVLTLDALFEAPLQFSRKVNAIISGFYTRVKIRNQFKGSRHGFPENGLLQVQIEQTARRLTNSSLGTPEHRSAQMAIELLTLAQREEDPMRQLRLRGLAIGITPDNIDGILTGIQTSLSHDDMLDNAIPTFVPSFESHLRRMQSVREVWPLLDLETKNSLLAKSDGEFEFQAERIREILDVPLKTNLIMEEIIAIYRNIPTRITLCDLVTCSEAKYRDILDRHIALTSNLAAIYKKAAALKAVWRAGGMLRFLRDKTDYDRALTNSEIILETLRKLSAGEYPQIKLEDRLFEMRSDQIEGWARWALAQTLRPTSAN